MKQLLSMSYRERLRSTQPRAEAIRIRDDVAFFQAVRTAFLKQVGERKSPASWIRQFANWPRGRYPPDLQEAATNTRSILK
jgi:hypothetical protein